MLLAMTPAQATTLMMEVDAASARTRALVAGLDEAALTKRPPSGGWSVAEALQHLILTADAMIPLAEKALAELESVSRKSTRKAGLGFVGWLLYASLEPPARVKIRTTKPFEPIAVDDPPTLAQRLGERDAKVRALIERASGLDTTSVKVTSPFNEKAKYNLYAAFRILLAHERRHLWQAERAKTP